MTITQSHKFTIGNPSTKDSNFERDDIEVFAHSRERDA